MNERLKQIRVKLNLSQEEFGTKIGIESRSHISLLESGKRNITDRIINDICREFNVNENWLRTGVGGEENMFVPEDVQYFQSVEKLGAEKNDFKKFYLNMMMRLPDEYWDYIYKEFKNFYKESSEEMPSNSTQNSERNPLFDGIPDTPEELERMYPVIDMKNKKDIG